MILSVHYTQYRATDMFSGHDRSAEHEYVLCMSHAGSNGSKCACQGILSPLLPRHLSGDHRRKMWPSHQSRDATIIGRLPIAPSSEEMSRQATSRASGIWGMCGRHEPSPHAGQATMNGKTHGQLCIISILGVH